jgi:hypothetical protein
MKLDRIVKGFSQISDIFLCYAGNGKKNARRQGVGTVSGVYFVPSSGIKKEVSVKNFYTSTTGKKLLFRGHADLYTA